MNKEKLISEITETQQNIDSVTMEIGQEYSRYYFSKKENLKVSINANVEVLQQLEIRLNELNKELKVLQTKP